MNPATSCAPIAHGHDHHDEPIELIPEIMLPVQFDDLRRNGVLERPEHRLMLAVLEDAVHVYQVGCGEAGRRAMRLFAEAEQWFASEATSSPFAFITICQFFGLDAEYIRSGLRRWRVARDTGRTTARAMPMRIRHVSGTRHRVTMRRARGPHANAADQWQ